MYVRVAELWRYPVKSVGGEQVDRVEVDELGLRGDRAFGFVDLGTGMVLTGRRLPALLMGSARWIDATESVAIEVDGRVLTDDDEFSEWLGRPVRLERAGDVGGTFENPLDVEREANWAVWTGPPGAWHDSARTRVSLVSRATLGVWDARRFRANVVLDGVDVPGDEDRLVGTVVDAGSARLDVGKQIDRCIMVTREQPGIDRDLEVLRRVHRERGGFLAVGALVTQSGVVQIGDDVRAVDGQAQAG